MSQQRKLTDEELQVVMDSRFHIRGVAGFACDKVFWQAVLSRLNLMATRSTTDGEYCAEPEPPIPDGYRLAVAGDEIREDARWWDEKSGRYRDSGKWSAGVAFGKDCKHIVPIDRVPTDDDAKSRPEVMVRNAESYDWQREVLVAVISTATYPFYVKGIGGCRQFRQCRHLYPGE